jgi:UDP-GlcNAc3NAcA epimerase
MYDACLRFAGLAAQRSVILSQLRVEPGKYLLATLHRPYNVDSAARLSRIMTAFGRTREAIVLPQHPRLALRLRESAIAVPSNVRLIDPIGYLDMVMLEKTARMILTDSGGVQKEAYFHAVPCVTLRPETEWVETVAAGWNLVADADVDAILTAVTTRFWPDERPALFGDGHAAERLVQVLQQAVKPAGTP